MFAHMLLGYGLLQALILLRMLPWIFQQSFSPAYWAFSFGVTALAAGPLRMVERGDTGPAAVLAMPLFLAANLVILLLVIFTLRLALQGKLVPRPVPASLNASGHRSHSGTAIDQYEFGIFQRRDAQGLQLGQSRAIAGIHLDTVDAHAAFRRHQIAKPFLAQRIVEALAGFQRGAEHPGIGTDRQRRLIIGKARGQHDELARSGRLWGKAARPSPAPCRWRSG